MRRVALGSGLELTKLADTIRQLADADPLAPVLICQDESSADAWIHLSLAPPGADDVLESARGWVLMLGYPAADDLEVVLAAHRISLPAGSRVLDVKPGLHATIHIPFEAPTDEIARSIHDVMGSIQNVKSSTPVELTLEYP